jgi:hypothetical protein
LGLDFGVQTYLISPLAEKNNNIQPKLSEPKLQNQPYKPQNISSPDSRGTLVIEQGQFRQNPTTQKVNTVIPLTQHHVTKSQKPKTQISISQNTHTKKTQTNPITNKINSQGSMTWQNINEIPRKP